MPEQTKEPRVPKKMPTIKTSKGSEMVDVHIPRAAVVPFTIRSGTIYFLLGTDAKSGDLTDFGGGSKKKESVIDTSIRELQEELGNSFVGIDLNEELQQSIAAHTDSLSTIFLPIRDETVISGFIPTDEISKIEWFSANEFERLTRPTGSKVQMWSRLRKFYALVVKIQGFLSVLSDNYNTADHTNQTEIANGVHQKFRADTRSILSYLEI